jgi:hypothetical protein
MELKFSKLISLGNKNFKFQILDPSINIEIFLHLKILNEKF